MEGYTANKYLLFYAWTIFTCKEMGDYWNTPDLGGEEQNPWSLVMAQVWYAILSKFLQYSVFCKMDIINSHPRKNIYRI